MNPESTRGTGSASPSAREELPDARTALLKGRVLRMMAWRRKLRDNKENQPRAVKSPSSNSTATHGGSLIDSEVDWSRLLNFSLKGNQTHNHRSVSDDLLADHSISGDQESNQLETERSSPTPSQHAPMDLEGELRNSRAYKMRSHFEGHSLSGDSDELEDRWSVGTRESRQSVRSLPLSVKASSVKSSRSNRKRLSFSGNKEWSKGTKNKKESNFAGGSSTPSLRRSFSTILGGKRLKDHNTKRSQIAVEPSPHDSHGKIFSSFESGIDPSNGDFVSDSLPYRSIGSRAFTDESTASAPWPLISDISPLRRVDSPFLEQPCASSSTTSKTWPLDFPQPLNNSTIDASAYRLEATFQNVTTVHPEGGRCAGVWTEIKVIGEGGQGAVFLEQCPTQKPQLRAVKRIPQLFMKSNNIDIHRELVSMIAVAKNNELFVRFYGWYQDPGARCLYIAMEYLPHGDLGQYLQNERTEAKRLAPQITRQLLEGLTILHGMQICHRDIKPQNVMISSLKPMKIKLADFGLSKSTHGTQLRTRFGTISYMAPELLDILPRQRTYTMAVDMWSLGCLVHELLTGEVPFLLAKNAESITDPSGFSSSESGQRSMDISLLSQYCKGEVMFPTALLRAAKAEWGATLLVESLLIADPAGRVSPVDALKLSWISGGPPGRVDSLWSQRRWNQLLSRLNI